MPDTKIEMAQDALSLVAQGQVPADNKLGTLHKCAS